MSITDIHGIFAASLGSTILGGIRSQSGAAELETREEALSGEVYARHQSIVSGNPTFDFTTLNLNAALAVCAELGTDIASFTGGLSLWAQLHKDAGTRATGAVHRKYNAPAGYLYPATIDFGNHQDDATLSYRAMLTSDGVNNPMSESDGVALPTAPEDAGRYTIGKMTLGGVLLDSIRGGQIDFGISATAEGSDSDIYPSRVRIGEIIPVLTLRGVNVKWLGSAIVPREGFVCTHANTILYLRKRGAGGTFVANGNPEHVKMTCNGLAVIDGAFDGTGNDPMETTIRLRMTFNGTIRPLVVSVNSAIA